MLLENVSFLYHQLQHPDVRALFKRSLSVMSDANPPMPWWNSDMDLLLISGVFVYGYGNYEEMRSDPEFCNVYRQSCLELGLRQDPKLHQEVQMIWDWPATETLTKRLRRTTEILLKSQAKAKPKDTPKREARRTLIVSLSSVLDAVDQAREAGHGEELDGIRIATRLGHRWNTCDHAGTKTNSLSMNKIVFQRLAAEMTALLRNGGLDGVNVAEGRSLCMELVEEMEMISSLKVHEACQT